MVNYLTAGLWLPVILPGEYNLEAATNPSLLKPTGLHPSPKEYARWAGKPEEIIRAALK